MFIKKERKVKEADVKSHRGVEGIVFGQFKKLGGGGRQKDSGEKPWEQGPWEEGLWGRGKSIQTSGGGL